MSALITVLIVIASIILILVVLVQKSKGGGLSSNFSSSNAIMGVRKTTDLLEKATWGLAGFIIVMSIVAVMVRPATKKNGGNDFIPVNTNQQAAPAPQFPTTIPEGVEQQPITTPEAN